jgi:hypothetical protein
VAKVRASNAVTRFGRALLPLVAAGCIIETVPLPEGEAESAASDHVVTSEIYYTESPAILVGAEGAVTPLARVVVRNRQRPTWQGETDASPDGSFNMPMNAAAGDTLEIDVVGNGEILATAALVIEAPSNDARLTNDALEGYFGDSTSGANGVAVAAPNVEGMVSVGGGPGSVQAGIAVVVANVTGGNATVAAAALDGSFSATLAAGSGDELSVFAVEPATSNAGSKPVTVFVP